jgi:hypothetical protein
MRYRPTLTNLRRPHDGARPAGGAPEAKALIGAQPLERLEFLDSLRGIVALVVLLAHALEYSWAPYDSIGLKLRVGKSKHRDNFQLIYRSLLRTLSALP